MVYGCSPKDGVLEPVNDYAIEAEDTTGLKKAYDSYLHKNHPNVENHNYVSGGRDYSYRRPTASPEYTRYESSDIPYGTVHVLILLTYRVSQQGY